MMRTEYKYETRGDKIRACAKSLILEFMQATDSCQPGKEGVRLCTIAEKCGLKDGIKNNTWWVSALLQELKKEGKVDQIGSKSLSSWKIR